MNSVRSVLALLALGVGSIGCATGDDNTPLDWDEFKARAVQEPVTGTFIYDGDQTAEDLDDLYQAYREYRELFDDGSGLGVARCDGAGVGVEAFVERQ